MRPAESAGLELGLRREAMDAYQSPTLQLAQLRLARHHYQTVAVTLPDIKAQREVQ
jgi:hypothetical protein